MIKKKGQGMIEMVFAIGLVGLVLTGLVTLMVKSTGTQTKTSRRNEAVTLSKLVMEEMVALSKNEPNVFWQKQNLTGQTKPDFGGFTYGVGFTSINSGGTCATPNRCVEVVVRVTWMEEALQEVYFNRFFSR